MVSKSIDDRWHVVDQASGRRVRSSRYGVGLQWRARYRVAAGGKQTTKAFARKVDAQRWLDEVTTNLNTGQYVTPESGRTLFGALAEDWIVGNPKWSATTRARNRSVLDNHVLPRWRDTRVADLGHDDVQKWVNELPGAGGTVRKAFGVFASVVDLAVARKCLPSNNFRAHVRLPTQALAPRRYLTHGQVAALAHACGDVGRPVVLTLAYCGLRVGELSALRIGDVNVARSRLMVERSVTEVNGKLVWSAPKDGERRSVPVPQFVMEEIEGLIDGRGPEEQVFTSPLGDVLRVRNMRRSWFDRAAKEVGLEGLVPHELRHTLASLAVSAGASVLAVQRMLGHSKPSVTLDVYSDLFDGDLDDVAQRLHDGRARLDPHDAGLPAAPTASS
ncbi:tyrosine-type recombinase/integrase [Branchiibius cervicis]|uniref:Tyrosine-type recombinase/integrase n=1 Tax=Branchiibius cervicis TaxID=908252 RepID=A0ABW2AXC5_9MICO